MFPKTGTGSKKFEDVLKNRVHNQKTYFNYRRLCGRKQGKMAFYAKKLVARYIIHPGFYQGKILSFKHGCRKM